MSPDANRSLSHRIRIAAGERDVDPARLRRHLVFHRILARLADSGQWVLKGGFCLEVRLNLAGRATQDLDLAVMQRVPGGSPLELQELLADALEGSDLADGFRFEVGRPAPLSARDLGQPGWRIKVRALVGGEHFEEVKLDVVEASSEVEDGVEVVVIEPLITGLDLSPVEVLAVDIGQHAAEKIHAYARIYAHDRPSSRVKDLVDLVLLIEAGLVQASTLGTRLTAVFISRDGAPPPRHLPDPPAGWTDTYADMADDLELTARDVQSAWRLLDTLYQAAIRTLHDEGRT